jgi:alginate O-acetyltransferase complex protein AlgI
VLFNSYIFILAFLPLVLLGWWIPRDTTVRLLILVSASFIFYGWFDWRFMALMFIVGCSGYWAGRCIAMSSNPDQRKSWLIFVIATNLVLLGYFKYSGLFSRLLDNVADIVGYPDMVSAVEVLLPLGISFYIFENLSYCIDIYRGRATPARNFLHYMLFISIFPKLIAGPIIRYTDVEAQYARLRDRIDIRMMWIGVVFFVVGLAKKIVIADRAAAMAMSMLELPSPSFQESWVAVGAYTIQIYFDFSAYSDMAVGLGFMLGFQFPQNFNRPYMATDITDFWDRWHITLSRWLRDYLFIPLGGSRKGSIITLRNLFIVMFLGGLWHGANWTFVVWGMYHGLLLASYHTWTQLRKSLSFPQFPLWPSRALTLVAVMFGWALFASPDFQAAGDLIHGMIGGNGFSGLNPFSRLRGFSRTAMIAMVIATLWILFVPEVWNWRLLGTPRRRHAVVAAVVAFVCLGALGGFSPFIYYQF